MGPALRARKWALPARRRRARPESPPRHGVLRGATVNAWSGSLALRTVLTTLGLSLVVVALVATALLNRVGSGLLDAKQERSLTEATADWEQSVQILAAADTGPSTASPDRIIEGVVSVLARNSGSPAAYELLLLQEPFADATGPERATNLISPASVPDRLAVAIAVDGAQMWTNTTAQYLDGSEAAAMVIGAPVDVPGVGDYQLFHIFPYTEEERIISLVRSATLVAGTFLILLLGAVVWLVSRQMVVPIRQASRVAGQIAEGNLDQRIPVRGADEMARLATSFNDMAYVLQEQIRELEDLSQVQQRFVSDVSHELRTPLTTIRMATDVMHDRRDLVDSDTKRAIELLAAQVDRFEWLLSDLLEISRIDAGAAEVDLEEIDLAVLVASVVASTKPLAEERGVDIRTSMAADVTVLADRRRVSRIVRNLINNALQYGQGRPIDILVASDGRASAVGVRDRGWGLDEEQQRRVFDRFWRADASRSRAGGGSGLGLSIALEDSVLLKGTLEVVSELGRGTAFVLTLPSLNADRARLTRPVPLALDGFDLMVRRARAAAAQAAIGGASQSGPADVLADGPPAPTPGGVPRGVRGA